MVSVPHVSVVSLLQPLGVCHIELSQFLYSGTMFVCLSKKVEILYLNLLKNLLGWEQSFANSIYNFWFGIQSLDIYWPALKLCILTSILVFSFISPKGSLLVKLPFQSTGLQSLLILKS